MNRFVLVVVGVVFQPDVIHNIDGLILSALKYILSCLFPKMVPKKQIMKYLYLACYYQTDQGCNK